jgi:hypothetical protein
MKASELITLLQKAIQEHGDLRLSLDNCDCQQPIGIEHVPGGTPYLNIDSDHMPDPDYKPSWMDYPGTLEEKMERARQGLQGPIR